MNMKKLKLELILIFCAFVTIIGTGCEREKDFSIRSMSAPTMSNEIKSLYNQMPTRTYSDISVVGDGILRFPSYWSYVNHCQQLKEDCALWDSLFYSAYDHMDEFELMDWMDSIGYNEYLPILIFEDALNRLGSTLFDQQQAAIHNWTENEFNGDNPTDKIFIFEWEQALYNEYREVCVGDTIYQFRVDATIKYPLDKIEDWLGIRELPTIELVEIDGIITEDYLPKNGNGEDKVRFICSDDGEYNVDNMPEVFSGLDYSYWAVRGKVGFWGQESRLESKLVNYKFHKIKKNGKKVFKTVKRNCCIQPTHQIFYRDHCTFSGDVLHTEEVECTILEPSPRLQKRATGNAWAFVPMVNLHRPVKYVRGVYQHPTLYVNIEGYERYPVVDLKH